MTQSPNPEKEIPNSTRSAFHDPFDGFRSAYPAHPSWMASTHPDQMIPMTAEDGRCTFGVSKAPRPTLLGPPANETEAPDGRHLWAIGTDDAPFALERSPFGAGLNDGVIEHTNLTGGGDAHCGGEIWFLPNGLIFINADSGRYGPKSFEELRAAALALSGVGYSVGYVVYDAELGKPPKIALSGEEVEWTKSKI